MQNQIALSVSLAGFAQKSAENELLPKLIPGLGISLAPELKQKIATELAIGLISCAHIPDKAALNDVWGLEGESLRQMVAILVFSESSDSRHTLENAGYSSNPNEARLQILLSIVRLTGSKDDNLITRLNTQEFGALWNRFANEFIVGAVEGFRRSQRAAMIESISSKLESLSARGEVIIEEMIGRFSNVQTKRQEVAENVDTPNNRAKALFSRSLMKAQQLCNQLTSMMGLPPLDLPEFQNINDGMLIQWQMYCIAYTANLLFIVQLTKDSHFYQSKEFPFIYMLSLMHMTSLQKDLDAHCGHPELFDKNKALGSAKQLFNEIAHACIFYKESRKNPYAENKLIELFMSKIGVPDNLRDAFAARLREFNAKTLNEFEKL